MGHAGTCARREQILRAAERLFLHYGFAKTTVADIAREAAVAVGSVYLEFSSKDAIVAEFSACRYQAVLTELTVIVQRQGTAESRLRAFFAHRMHAFSNLATQGQHACELVACTSTAVHAAYQTYARAELDLVVTLLMSGVQRGEFAKFPDLQRTAQALVRAYATYAPPWGGHEIPADLRALLDVQHTLVLQGLARRGA